MKKIKSFVESEGGKDILIVIIVILVGLVSFELGRLSKENGSSGIKILSAQAGSQIATDVELPVSVRSTSVADNKTFFASSKGSKYYSLGCSAGKTIKQENRVYFTTGEEAQAAGYTLSTSCR
jgi:hypothetical protein